MKYTKSTNHQAALLAIFTLTGVCLAACSSIRATGMREGSQPAP